MRTKTIIQTIWVELLIALFMIISVPLCIYYIDTPIYYICIAIIVVLWFIEICRYRKL